MMTIRSINGVPLKWKDGTGIIHGCEGGNATPKDFILWTICKKHDVPANKGFASFEEITCHHCKTTLEQEKRS